MDIEHLPKHRVRELAEEFLRTPFGFHSADLQRMVRWLRTHPGQPMIALLTVVPGQEWEVFRLDGERGGKVEMTGRRFFNLDEAERQIFTDRVRNLLNVEVETDPKGVAQ